MSLAFDPLPFIVTTDLGQHFIRASKLQYDPEASNPYGGRFHQSGQPTYYYGSGNATVKAELGLAAIDPEKYRTNSISPGEYTLFHMPKYLAMNPELTMHYFRLGEKGGWQQCQELRNGLQQLGYSGVVYESTKMPGALNVAFWDVENKALPRSFFDDHLIAIQ